MKSQNYPYRAKAHSPVKPMSETACKGEYCSTSVQGNTKPMKRPQVASAKGSMHDGPYGGKKKA